MFTLIAIVVQAMESDWWCSCAEAHRDECTGDECSHPTVEQYWANEKEITVTVVNGVGSVDF